MLSLSRAQIKKLRTFSALLIWKNLEFPPIICRHREKGFSTTRGASTTAVSPVGFAAPEKAEQLSPLRGPRTTVSRPYPAHQSKNNSCPHKQ